MQSRRGFSLIELTVGLMLVGVLSAMVAPKVYEATDYNNVVSVKRSIVTHLASAQSSAVQRGRQVSVHIENDSIWIAVVKTAGDSAIPAKRSLIDMGATDVEEPLAPVVYDSRGFAVGLALTGAKVRIHGIGMTDSVCVTRMGMVPTRGCL